MKRCSSAFTWVEIIITIALIGLLAAIAIPNFVAARNASQKNACIANLKTIQGAKSLCATERKMVIGESVTANDLYGPTNYIRYTPTCPAHGTYTIGEIGNRPTCSLGKRGHKLD